MALFSLCRDLVANSQFSLSSIAIFWTSSKTKVYKLILECGPWLVDTLLPLCAWTITETYYHTLVISYLLLIYDLVPLNTFLCLCLEFFKLPIVFIAEFITFLLAGETSDLPN